VQTLTGLFRRHCQAAAILWCPRAGVFGRMRNHVSIVVQVLNIQIEFLRSALYRQALAGRKPLRAGFIEFADHPAGGAPARTDGAVSGISEAPTTPALERETPTYCLCAGAGHLRTSASAGSAGPIAGAVRHVAAIHRSRSGCGAACERPRAALQGWLSARAGRAATGMWQFCSSLHVNVGGGLAPWRVDQACRGSQKLTTVPWW